MSCKYCKPIKGYETTQPLIEIAKPNGRLTATVWIDEDMLCANVHTLDEGKTEAHWLSIGFCPVCGEKLRQFGPPWGHRREPKER